MRAGLLLLPFLALLFAFRALPGHASTAPGGEAVTDTIPPADSASGGSGPPGRHGLPDVGARETDTLNLRRGLTVQGHRREKVPVQTGETLQGHALEKTRGLPLGRALESVSGVTVLSTGSAIAKPMVNGLFGNRVLILNNGIRQEGQQWGMEHAPEIDPFLASRLTVLKGASGLRYGSDALGGVILVEPPPLPRRPGLAGELNLVGFSNNREGAVSGQVEGASAALPGLGLRLQGTAKKAGNQKTPAYHLKNTGFAELNYSAALGYARGPWDLEAFHSEFDTRIGIFSGSHIGNLTDLRNALDRKAPAETADFSYRIDRPYQSIAHSLSKARAGFSLGPVGKVTATYAFQDNRRREYDKHKPLSDSLAALDRPELDFDLATHSGEIAFDHRLGPRLSGTLGVDGLKQANVYQGRPFVPNFRHRGAGSFLTQRWEGDKAALEAGSRFDYRYLEVYRRIQGRVDRNLHEFGGFSGMAGGVLGQGGPLAARVTASTAWRAPSVNELYSDGLHHGAAAVEIGDTALVPERAFDLTLGLDWHPFAWLHLEAEGYRNHIDDYIYLNPEMPPTLTIRGAFPTFRFRQADVVLTGLDLTLGLHLGEHWNYHAEASGLRGENRETGEGLVLLPADRHRHTLAFTGDRVPGPLSRLFREGEIELGLEQVLRQGRVPAAEDYAPPPPGHTLFHAGVSASLGRAGPPTGEAPKERSAEIEIRVENLFDTSYRDYLNRLRYYADEPGRNFKVRLLLPFSL